MIVIDTNVLSALMREVPERPVVEWLDRQAAESVWITSITLFEARLGLALLPKSKRRRALESAFDKLLVEDLEGRVLDFDQPAAEAAAQLAAGRQRGGQTVDMRDSGLSSHVEPNVEWIASCLAEMRARNATRIEPTAEAEAEWTRHVDDVAAATVLAKMTDSWLFGANTPGKARRVTIYAAGARAYREHCEDVARRGYPGVVMS